MERLNANSAAGKGGALDIPPELFVGLGKLIKGMVREAIAVARGGAEGDPWIPHPRWPCSSRRAAVVLARSGALAGVRKVGRLFLVRQSALDAYVEAEHQKASAEEEAPPEDDFTKAMHKAGLQKRAARGGR